MPIGTGAVILIVSLSAAGVGGLGFMAGRSTAPEDRSAVEAIQAQGETLEAITAGQTVMVDTVATAVNAEMHERAALSDKLANTPPQCVIAEGGHPNSINCTWAWCTRTGQSDKQRCDVSKLQDALILDYEISERTEALDEREKALDERDADGCPEPVTE